MIPTRRWIALAGAVCFLSVFGVLLRDPLPILAAGGLTAWLAYAQLDAVRTVRAVDEHISASVSITEPGVFVGDRTALTVTASVSVPFEVPIEVELVAPPSVSAPEEQQRTATIQPGARSAATTCSVAFPIAGQITFDTLCVSVEGPNGYFTEQIPLDADASCLVSPPSARDIHVGQGGESVGAMFGSHSTDRTGPGLLPHGTRQYVAGDTVSRIDWKTTARMNELYIREFESEADYLLSLVVDAGPHMNAGPAGRTKLAYAREVALSCVRVAKSYGDPIAARFADEGGRIWEFGPSSSADAYQTVQSRLLDQKPGGRAGRAVGPSQPTAPSEALARGKVLDDDSTFATTLRPFLRETASYVTRVGDRPVFDAVRSACADADRGHHLVLVTDDTSKVETYEAVVLASEQSRQTSVFLTPSVLFDDNRSDSRDGFVEFEEFRERLNRLPNVSAYEVAPRDAIDRVKAEFTAIAGDA